MKQVILNRVSTIQLPINKKGILIYGVSTYVTGSVSIILNDRAKKELTYIGDNNLSFLYFSKDDKDGYINVKNQVSDYDITFYYRFIAIE